MRTSEARADYTGWQPGQARHLNTIGPIGHAIADLVQEYNLIFPFLDLDRHIGGPLQLLGQRGEFMIVGGEQRGFY